LITRDSDEFILEMTFDTIDFLERDSRTGEADAAAVPPVPDLLNQMKTSTIFGRVRPSNQMITLGWTHEVIAPVMNAYFAEADRVKASEFWGLWVEQHLLWQNLDPFAWVKLDAAGEVKSYANEDGDVMYREKKEVVKFLRVKIKRVEKIMLALIHSDEQTSECYKLILSVPGFGIITASYLLIVTECFSLFSSSRQLACFGGIAPFKHSSGKSIRGKVRVSPKADKKLKGLSNPGVSTLLLHHDNTKNLL